MEEKNTRRKRGGRSVSLVLFCCAAVVGVSAWSLFAAGRFERDVVSDTGEDTKVSVSDGEQNIAGTYPDLGVTNVFDEVVPDKVPVSDENFENNFSETANPVENAENEPAISDGAVENEPPTFVWPVSGEVAAAFSADTPTYDRTMADWRTHEAIDIAAEIGTRVFAAADGTVSDVYADTMYGTTVVIEHAGGIVSVYSNLAATPTVSIGDAVKCGDVIGSVGDTALCYQGDVSHLHFAMSAAGSAVNPEDYMP